MSRLIAIDPQIQQETEPEGYEFGYYLFDTLPTIEISNIEMPQEKNKKGEEEIAEKQLALPLNHNMLLQLQLQDKDCANIITQIERGNIKEGQIYIIQNKLLKRYVIDGDKMYEG